MNRIRIMSEELANQIAAGEVIERPASVVKELVENAIDAQSSAIQVDVEEGGIKRIQVTDNGCGMSRADSQLAFERHATSKIKTERDLLRISSLGFRGEALPSIAAVAKVNLQTWDGQEKEGTRLTVDKGSIVDIQDAPLRQGTVVEVTDLFYNTPARYKYLKSISTELSHIIDYMNRLAMAHMDIAFRLTHNGRQLLTTSGKGDARSVLAHIYGYQVAQRMIPFKADHIDFSVSGLLSRPEETRANRHFITVIINGRYVKHYGLHQAVLRAYHTLLPINRYPIALLNITMDPVLLDVNVHPAKLEIRLSKEKELLEWLENKMKTALFSQVLIPQSFSSSAPVKKKRVKSAEVTQPSFDLHLPRDTDKKDEESSLPSSDKWSDHTVELTRDKTVELLREKNDQIKEPHQPYPLPHAEQSVTAPKAPLSSNAEQPAACDADQSLSPVDLNAEKEQAQPQKERIPFLSLIGQLLGTYILAQNEDGLYLIDQHAAQERIWYEYFLDQLNQTEQPVQMLAVPIVLEFTAQEAVLLEKQLPVLQEAGLQIENFGHHAYMVRSYPVWFPEQNPEGLIREIIDFVIHYKGNLSEVSFRKDIAQMACKQAIKANRYLTQEEMEALLEKLRECSNPYTCPHGRPITVKLSKYEIEKMFKRVM